MSTIRKNDTKKLRIIPLGGLSEIGKNMTAIEFEDDIIVIDCGLSFPDNDMYGIDAVIPDVSYLEEKYFKIKGIFLTHGHEDHIGAIPYVIDKLKAPIYGTRLTLGILRNKLEERETETAVVMNEVRAGDIIDAGVFSVEFIHVNHSIPDSCALLISTPLGDILHTGDFKIDFTPVDGGIMDLPRLARAGDDGVLLMMGESTNVERPGYTPSESNVGKTLEEIFIRFPEKRIIISTFSSNVHRVQQIINISARNGRKIAIMGRSMLSVVNAARELGYINVPDNSIIDISEVGNYQGPKVTIIATGSQGEPMSALYRMAYNETDKVQLTTRDLVVISAHPIPGNEKLVGNIINELARRNIEVFRDSAVPVHVSGHACAEELKIVHTLVWPRYFMPVHGEFRHLMEHKKLAQSLGMSPEDIFVMNNGDVLEITEKEARLGKSEKAGAVLVDGLGIGDVGSVVLRDRKRLAESGLIAVVATVDDAEHRLITPPEIQTRGFIYVKESGQLIEDLKAKATEIIESGYQNGKSTGEIKLDLKDGIGEFVYMLTKREPMILSVINEI